ncbi:phage terminase small subunit [Microbulbifer spongiae]|uniref:Phage terminase small subunit n=1 Tax=Microbulbifer spongiae TaxID=2944933 RepID=A0ABY9E8S2_9GAMM|nr:phage terminase small subunit [Microbulbifer sp. MI-G]WKD48346.1 phage terminase small subunit [Microbulbifer sp. MI-G]
MPFITLQHQQRARARAAAQASAAAPTVSAQTDVTHSPDRSVIAAALQADLQLLSERANVQEKIALKRHLLPKYLPHVKGYRESGAQYPNPLLVYCLVWLLDVEDIEQALELAALAIAQQQQLPARFNRDLPTFVAETLHDWAERQYMAKRSASPYFEQVLENVEQELWPVTHIIVRTKLYRLAAMFAERNDAPKAAVQWLEKAQAVNPEKAGVKTWLGKLKRQLAL